MLGLRTGVRTTGFPAREDPDACGAPAGIRFRPGGLTPVEALEAAALCPTSAITAEGTPERGSLRFDAGQCVMCGLCVRAFPRAFRFTTQPQVAVSARGRLQHAVRWERGGPLLEEAVAEAASGLRERAGRIFGHSLHIRHVDAGSCNGCESELQLLASPYYDLHRLGFFFTPTPRHADLLLVTGVVTRQMEGPLRATWQAMPEPKLVVAAGTCAVGGGPFEGGPMTHGPLDRILPVDVYVPGSPPTPLALLHGLLLAVGRAEEGSPANEEGNGT